MVYVCWRAGKLEPRDLGGSCSCNNAREISGVSKLWQLIISALLFRRSAESERGVKSQWTLATGKKGEAGREEYKGSRPTA